MILLGGSITKIPKVAIADWTPTRQSHNPFEKRCLRLDLLCKVTELRTGLRSGQMPRYHQPFSVDYDTLDRCPL